MLLVSAGVRLLAQAVALRPKMPCVRHMFACILLLGGFACCWRVYYRTSKLGCCCGCRSATPDTSKPERGAPLELAFESKELRDICENDSDARRQVGGTVAEMLRDRLAD